jgi:DNA-binding GntR family transcriptional regulator
LSTGYPTDPSALHSPVRGTARAGADGGRGGGPTRTDIIGERLRDDILAGSLKPGQRLRFQELQRSYNVGLTPLREALFKLSAEGLVATTSRRGFKVAPMSLAELEEITRLRQMLERVAIIESVANGDDAWEGRIILAFHRLSKLEETDPAWQFWHRSFHNAIVAACNSPILHRIRQDLFDQAIRYRRLSMRLSADRRDHSNEHRAIMEACIARDGEKTAELVTNHFAFTRKVILDAVARGETTVFLGEIDGVA